MCGGPQIWEEPAAPAAEAPAAKGGPPLRPASPSATALAASPHRTEPKAPGARPEPAPASGRRRSRGSAVPQAVGIPVWSFPAGFRVGKEPRRATKPWAQGSACLQDFRLTAGCG